MPISSGLSVHDDTQHKGSAKRDVANGIAGLSAGGSILALGARIIVTRDEYENIYFQDRTAGEDAMFFNRVGANNFAGFIKSGGANSKIQIANMKDAASGIAGLDASGDLNHSVYAGLLQKYHISDDVLHTHDGSVGTNSLSYVKMRTITLNALSPSPSTLRVAFCLRTTGTGFTAYGRIYKNGAPFGTEQTEDSAEPCDWYSEDLSFAQGDTLELWCKISNASWYAYVDNFQVRGIEDQLLSYAILETDLGVADAFTATNS